MAKEETAYDKRRQMRIDVFKDTMAKVAANHDKYVQLAERNLERAASKPRGDIDGMPFTVSVIKRDCLEAAADLLHKYGVKPAVLNMANARKMGGGVKSGSGAQEENMFRRTTCYLNRSVGLLSKSTNEVFKEGDTYSDWFANEVYGGSDTGLVPIYDAVCFKEEEAKGYADRTDRDIFPFYELRSAAQNLNGGKPFNPKRCEHQVRAQFRTLGRMKAQAVVLSAFGCGAFSNDPYDVAEIYKKVIADITHQKKYPDLKVVVFAMIDPNKPDGDPGETLNVFQYVLGEASKPAASSSKVPPRAAASSERPSKKSRNELHVTLPDGTTRRMKGHEEMAYAAAMSRPYGWTELTIEGDDIGLRGQFIFHNDDGQMFITYDKTPMLIEQKGGRKRRTKRKRPRSRKSMKF